MESIIQIKGNVKFKITMDPGVWIFDDRKVDLDTYFLKENPEDNDLEEYTKSISRHWDREITEGAIYPPTLKTEKQYQKEKLLVGTFGIPLKPFLFNAEPGPDAKQVVLECGLTEVSLGLDEAYKLILGFSKDGKPLKEDGPVHGYFHDGSNQEHPIKNISGITII